jgi:hypothetical protein
MNNHHAWAQEVLRRIGRSGKRIYLLNEKIKAFDRAPWQRRLRAGGIFYRAYLEVCYQAALDDYVLDDIRIRE